jgi:hypothetical protein
VAQNEHVNIHFSMERGMRIMNYVKVFLSYITESYKQLRGQSFLVIGYHT